MYIWEDSFYIWDILCEVHKPPITDQNKIPTELKHNQATQSSYTIKNYLLLHVAK